MEVLRINPPLILLLRYVKDAFMAATSAGKEYYVPQGSIVAVSPTFNGTLNMIHEKPELFDPSRWEEPRKEQDVKGLPYTFIGFGGGRHRCMGENFAFVQIKTIWSHLIRNFDLDKVDAFPEPDYEAMVIGPKKCKVRFTRRETPLQPAE